MLVGASLDTSSIDAVLCYQQHQQEGGGECSDLSHLEIGLPGSGQELAVSLMNGFSCQSHMLAHEAGTELLDQGYKHGKLLAWGLLATPHCDRMVQCKIRR